VIHAREFRATEPKATRAVNARDVEQAMRVVAGTARSMGVEVDL
jgi:ribosomal protein L11